MDQRKTIERRLLIEASTRAKSTASSKVRPSFDMDGSSLHNHEFEPKQPWYKLEVLKSPRDPCKIMSAGLIFDTSNHAKNTLLDNYEIEWISRQLNYYMKSNHGKSQDGFSSDGETMERVRGITHYKVVLKKNSARWLWLKHGIPLPCGSSISDVVKSQGFSHRKKDKEDVPLMKKQVAGCRPQRRPSTAAYQNGEVGKS